MESKESVRTESESSSAHSTSSKGLARDFVFFILDIFSRDYRQIFYEKSFLEIFKWSLVIMTVTLVPSLFVFSLFSIFYTVLLYTRVEGDFNLWLGLSTGSLLTIVFLLVFSLKFIRKRVRRVSEGPKASEALEAFLAKVLKYVKQEKAQTPSQD